MGTLYHYAVQEEEIFKKSHFFILAGRFRIFRELLDAIFNLFGERLGRDDELATVLQVQGNALESRFAKHITIGRGADGIETYR